MSGAEGPLLVTDRLELWLPLASDFPQLAAMAAHPETNRFLGGQETMPELFARFCRNAGSWQLYGHGSFILRLRGGGGLIVGNCGVFHSWRGLGDDFDDRAEAGWIVAASHVGQGLAREAMDAALAWFDRRFGGPVVCMIAPGNTASLRLAGKLGFASMRDAELPSGDAVRLFRREAAF